MPSTALSTLTTLLQEIMTHSPFSVNFRSMYFYGHILILLGFASPWISAAFGMERGEKSNNVNGAQGITGSVVNNSAPKKQE